MRSPRTLVGIGIVLGFVIVRFLVGQGYKPEEAPKRMTVPPGFAVKLVASEPLVQKPVAIDFDDRGRLWVIQYLQYPNPAGLKRVKVDRYSRTVYDRVPEPPPRGPRGDDRITILEDLDSSGRARKARDFVRGLNLASGFAFGHGGVFVLQAPYLLFYPDRDGDDVPDGDPQVLLTGFGMEDAHSVANSLTWGPDGWLYGCQGSTVTARIRGIEFQQGVWRYHPLTRRFELFCEGGGNSWGLDFDRHGKLLYSTNHGGFTMLHGVQGGYYWKSFGKHGPLHNPHAYGYFDHVPHRNFRGGHVTVGGILYRGDSFPPRFQNKYIAADLLGHNVYWHDLEGWGSTFRSRHGGELLLSNDTWFAPSDVTLGPDGSVYVADWHDKRTAHPDPDAEWDRSNGRIYKIEAKGTKPYTGGDLTKLPREKLLALLAHPNHWYVRKARRILADRRDPEVIFPLRTVVLESKNDQLALEALWALYVSGGFNEDFAAQTLGHRNPHIRRWTVRFLGDEGKAGPALARRLIELARKEPDVTVRSQLASSAKRFPPALGLPIVRHLVLRDEDGRDTYLPLLLWWAVEQHAVSSMNEVVTLFTAKKAWRSTLARQVILPRLVRRLAAEGTSASLTACSRLLASVPSAAERGRLIVALDEGLRDRPPDKGGVVASVPAVLDKLLASLWKDDTGDVDLIRLLARLDNKAAYQRAVTLAIDARVPVPTRVALLRCLGEVGRPECAGAVLKLVGGREPQAVQLVALEALPRFSGEEIGVTLLCHYPRLTGGLRTRAREVLLSRPRWALAFLRAVDAKKIDPREVPAEQLQRLALHRDRELDRLVRKHWGRLEPATPGEKLAEVRRLNNDLRAGTGNLANGQALFRKHCASCHRLFSEGHNVGPDLTHANRKDRDWLLVSIVDPSAVIRKEYVSYIVHTKDGRVLTGLLAEQTPGSVTLLGANSERTTIARGRIESIEESSVSLMPDNLYKALKPQELRDLFRYLQQ
jgi:putative membrane-bound dehydrogenase-like protein